MRIIGYLLSIIVMAVGLGACSGGSDSTPTVTNCQLGSTLIGECKI